MSHFKYLFKNSKKVRGLKLCSEFHNLLQLHKSFTFFKIIFCSFNFFVRLGKKKCSCFQIFVLKFYKFLEFKKVFVFSNLVHKLKNVRFKRYVSAFKICSKISQEFQKMFPFFKIVQKKFRKICTLSLLSFEIVQFQIFVHKFQKMFGRFKTCSRFQKIVRNFKKCAPFNFFRCFEIVQYQIFVHKFQKNVRVVQNMFPLSKFVHKFEKCACFHFFRSFEIVQFQLFVHKFQKKLGS